MTLNKSAAGGGPAYFPPISIGGIPKRFAFFAPDGDGGGGSGGGQGGEGDKGKGGKSDPFMVFESQDDLDEFVEKRVGRERRKWEGKVSTLEEQLETAKAASQGKGKDGEKLFTQAEVDALVAKKDEEITGRQKRIDGLLGVQRTNAILEASGNAYNPKQVAQLLEREIGFDEAGELVVLDEKGNPRLNPKNGKPLGVSDHVAAYLEANKHLVKGSGIGGAGSGGDKGQGGGGKPTYTQAQISDPAFYQANRDDIVAAANEGRIVD